MEVCRWLQDSGVGTAIRESEYFFPLVETVHVLALGISVGAVMWFDLRLMGVLLTRDSVADVFDQVRRWMHVGFAAMFITGGLMFWSLAARLYESGFFRIKMLLLVLAAINVAVFHLTVDRRRSEWSTRATPPLGARIAGLLSLVLWAAVIAAGRFTAYSV